MLAQTIPAMFLDVCRRFEGHAEKTAYARKHDGAWIRTTHDTLRHQVECFAAGLVQLGIAPGERVGIVSENRVEWTIADFAITAIGAVDVPIFPTLTAVQEAFIYANCEASCVIVSNLFQLRKIQQVWDSLTHLRHVIVMAEDVEVDGRVSRMSDVIRAGEAMHTAEERRAWFQAACARVRPDDLLTIIYTSGTTGHPKGVMLSHGNLTSNIAGAMQALPVDHTDVFLSYLPTCHAYERMSGYYLAFAVGATTYIAESIETVAENMRETSPTVMTSVPRLFERIRTRIIQSVEKEKPYRRKLFYRALEYGARYWQGERSWLLDAEHAITDRLVLAAVRKRTGGKLRFFVSGGAALNQDVGLFFFALGLTVLEGYGLTETSPVLAVNRPGDETLGTVGPPLPNVTIRIAEDGEILAKGPNVMLGYWQDQEATDAAIDKDGWLHTGDIGAFDAAGRLMITDRKKNIIVSSGGKNIAPGPVETLLVSSPLVEQILMIGEQREYCTALVVPDMAVVNQLYANRPGVNLHDAIQADFTRLQKDLSKYERVRKFIILDEPFTVDNGMLTPTLKVKRKIAEERYAVAIDRIYAEEEA